MVTRVPPTVHNTPVKILDMVYFLTHDLYNASILNDATTLTFDLNKQWTAFFYHGDQAEQVV
jgi:hypothetical protein